MPSISRRRITSPCEIGSDGLCLADGQHWDVSECIIDLSVWPLDQIDECAGITLGSSATFRNCVIRGAGKIVLCGCGDESKVPIETGKKVEFFDCILEDGSRRFPEVHDGMQVVMHGCLIRNWGDPDRFNYDRQHPDRNFGAWAHTENSRIDAFDCVFWQDSFWRPLRQMVLDWFRHIEQAWNEEGWRGLFHLSTYLPGVCRGLYATNGGEAYAWHCWKNKWWIALPWRHTTAMMDDVDAKILISRLETMAAELDATLPKDGTVAA